MAPVVQAYIQRAPIDSSFIQLFRSYSSVSGNDPEGQDSGVEQQQSASAPLTLDDSQRHCCPLGYFAVPSNSMLMDFTSSNNNTNIINNNNNNNNSTYTKQKHKKKEKNLYFLLNAKFVDVSVRIPLIVCV